MLNRPILIFHIGSLGDSIVSIPALRAIRSHYGKDRRIVMLHNQTGTALSGPREVLGETGLIDEFIAYPSVGGRSRIFQMVRLAANLMAKRFAAVIYLMRTERQMDATRRDALYFRLCLIPDLIGFIYPDQTQALASAHESEQLLNRIRLHIPQAKSRNDAIPLIDLSAGSQLSARRFLQSRRAHSERRLIGVCPGCKMDANRWPIQYFIELAQRIASDSRFELLILGGSAEKSAGEQISATVPGAIDCCGQFDVLGTAAVMKQCELVVGLDTGTTHLAAAVGVRCVAIYSARHQPFSPWEPMGAGHTVLRKEVPCQGCRLESCPVEGHPCLSLTKPEEVWAAICVAIVGKGQLNGPIAVAG